ncbi:MAG TPA: asparagine synthase (glutamine-hydrolyzing) [Candidatus Polarisedimenticolaceae bacterium]|nr:asparagine synthase (glutamine-hydrolyzing) [Candidatus Polarisedimenticolaceae bacterium]
MCGIVGIVKLDRSARAEEPRLRRMRDALAHRGPDAAALWTQGPVGLAHRRLSIVDVAGGAQPMSSPSGTAWIVFNGEIYNHPELLPRLRAQGHVYKTRCDTETILHLYEDRGEACVESLRGMFAFAIWDERYERLLLARDRLGIKPLYYALRGDELIFASEIKAILAAGVPAEFDASVLPEYLATRFVSGEGTFFRGIKKLLPGRVLTWSRSAGVKIRRYWRPPAPGSKPVRAAASDLRERLDESARLHLMSDVPLGVFLSGGLDSAAIVGLVAPMVSGPLRTFSVGFDEPEANELPWARLAAAAAGSVHREVVVSRSSFFRALPTLVWHEDEPIAFTSSVPLYFLAKVAAEDVKVVLTGEGADEIFLGYNRYRITAWNERLGRAWRAVTSARTRRSVARAARRLPGTLGRRLLRTFVTLGDDPRALALENFAVFPHELRSRLLTAPAGDAFATEIEEWEEAPGGAAESMSRADLQTYLVELLMKQDQMSMAASIESRVPYLDHELVEYAISIPARRRLAGFRTKAILRDAVKDVVPRAILNRRKMGFPVPLGRWLREGARTGIDELVLSPRALSRGFFEPAVVRALADEHRARVADHGERLWLLLNLEIWQRLFLDGDDPQALSEVLHA